MTVGGSLSSRRNLLNITTAIFLVILLSTYYCTNALPQFRYRDILLLDNKINDGTEVTSADINDDVEELYITQPIDHFDLSTNHITFQQRYFVSYKYHTKSNGPVLNFLCVGGEGPALDKSVLVDSVHCTGDMIELAKRIVSHHQYNIHLYAIEHRYYGQSYPKQFNDDEESPFSTQNLKYHNSRQALEDIAHFIHTINSEQQQQKQHNSNEMESSTTTTNGRWITFGGSYPGMLSLYARYKYPHLIYAAVSNSAPINIKTIFSEYKIQQGHDLQYNKVGGSVECRRIVKTAHNQATSLLQTPITNTTNGPIELATKYNICHPDTALATKRNQEILLGDGLIDIPAQNNDPSCTENEICNINGLCKFLIDEYTKIKQEENPPLYVELEVLAKVSQKQHTEGRYATKPKLQQKRRLRSNDTLKNNTTNHITLNVNDDDDDDDCISVDFQEMIKELSQPNIGYKSNSWIYRSWLYQTCNEFGFYQTCETDTCPFVTNYHLIDLDLEICNKVFNITNVYDNVAATIDHYGGLNIFNADSATSRILSINGNIDPWSMLGPTEQDSTKYDLPIKMVDGASHHFWTHSVKDTDTKEIVQIREYIYSVVMDWLQIESIKDGDDNGNNNSMSIERNNDTLTMPD